MANGIGFSDKYQDDGVWAFDAATGADLWNRRTSSPNGLWIAPKPIVANGVLYVNSGFVYALDPATGATLWSSREFAFARAVVNGHVYATQGNNLYVFSLA